MYCLPTLQPTNEHLLLEFSAWIKIKKYNLNYFDISSYSL